MERTWLQVIFIMLEIAVFSGLVLTVITLMRRSRKTQADHEKISEILSSAPFGYFYFLYDAAHPAKAFCSRRLAVLLGIYNLDASFQTVLDKLDEPSQKELTRHVETLQKTGKEFHIRVQNEHNTLRLLVTGMRACSVDGVLFADVLWFQDRTDAFLQQEENENWLKALQTRDTLLMQALDNLPFPFWMRNPDLTLAYCNQAYLKWVGGTDKEKVLQQNKEPVCEGIEKTSAKLLAVAAKNSGEMKQEKGAFIVDGQPKMLEIFEVPLNETDSKEERATMGFAQDIQREERLHQTLQNYLKAQYRVLSSLSAGIALFNANGYLQFYNQAFCEIWKLEEHVLENGPAFSVILDILREKRMLPEEANFIAYKHAEINQFSSLTQPIETIMHLPTGQILKRTMSPYPLGGVVMTFEDVTDRFSLERSFHEQTAIQKSIINHMKEGIIVFDGDGRLKLFNPSYADLFSSPKESLLHEPLLLDVIEAQKATLSASDDVWFLLKEKILAAIEEEKETPLTLPTTDRQTIFMKCVHLPDGGLLLSYEKQN